MLSAGGPAWAQARSQHQQSGLLACSSVVLQLATAQKNPCCSRVAALVVAADASVAFVRPL